MADGTPEPADARAEADARSWYHTIELAPGVETPGWFDLRNLASGMPIPTSLAGKRCLDIGTFDGFWAFEMERRGASEVVAIDVLDPLRWDWPAGSEDAAVAAIGERKGRGEGFEVARRALRSRVKRHEMSIYELDPAAIGRFDVVYIGSLLLHLRDPIGGLMRVREICDERLVLVDAIDLWQTMRHPKSPRVGLEGIGRPWWWRPNQAALVRMVEAAGFELVERPKRIFMRPGAGHPPPRFVPRALLNPFGREEMFRARFGDPHAAIAAS